LFYPGLCFGGRWPRTATDHRQGLYPKPQPLKAGVFYCRGGGPGRVLRQIIARVFTLNPSPSRLGFFIAAEAALIWTMMATAPRRKALQKSLFPMPDSVQTARLFSCNEA